MIGLLERSSEGESAMQQIVVEVFADDESEWWWEARQLRLPTAMPPRWREA
jgi:hypothetical protein